MTTYHLRGTDGTEVFTGTIEPPPGGGSQPVGILDPVRLAGGSNITLTGVQTVDGATTATGDRILAFQQTDPTENGIWIANDAGAWTRATDAAVYADMANKLVLSQYANGGTGNFAILFYEFGDAAPNCDWFPIFPFGEGAFGLGAPYSILDLTNIQATIGLFTRSIWVPNVAAANQSPAWAVDADGSERQTPVTLPADNALRVDGERAQVYDATSGKPVVRFKETDVDGTVTTGVVLASSGSQTTVGAAGAASALPATPTKYIKVRDVNGDLYVVPGYLAS